MYTVIKAFNERFDDRHLYRVGDPYPRDGFTPPKGRAEALATGGQSALNHDGSIYLEEATSTVNDELKEQLKAMDIDHLKAYADEHGIDIGNATSANGIIKKILGE
jgi:hypothetical protein